MPVFEIFAQDSHSRARAGILHTPHGDIETPVFMPVGTQATVKALTPAMLQALGTQVLLANTYHLALRPGAEIIQQAGGLHRFMAWDKPILTDSGGFQVYSLSKIRAYDADGVTFRNHVNGSKLRLTPENVIDLQIQFGSDIMMVLDVCPPSTAPDEEIDRALALTQAWAERSYAHWRSKFSSSLCFAIQQGGLDVERRQTHMTALSKLDFSGYAMGGLAVGEGKEALYRMISACTPMLPDEKPRYLMGVGEPEDLIYAIRQGVDMFDCVIPTRLGRHANVFTAQGTLNLKNARFRDDFTPIEAGCACYTCQHFTRAYLKHLYHCGEILGVMLASLHNIHFLVQLVTRERQRILANG